ncbi:MAG: restriction endonuclease subunit S [Leptospiraceae bacterium]|nr:restriction endonuclease subunit S [Leptospiraceae bacterium]
MNWKIKNLSDIATFSQGLQVAVNKQHTRKGPKQIRFIRIIDYTRDTEPPRFIDYPGERYCVQEDDIVMIRYGSPGLIGRGIAGVIANNLIKISVDNGEINKDYLVYCLKQPNIQEIIKGTSSSTMPAITFSTLQNLPIPLPPLDEQKRIVAILDEAFASLDQAIANTEKNLANAKELFESYLNSVFTNPGDDWEEKKLGEVVNFYSGGTPSKGNQLFWNGSIPWVSGRDMKGEEISSTSLSVSNLAIKEKGTKLMPEGTLLILVRGMGLANGIPISELKTPCSFNQDIKAMQVKNGIIPRFLLHSLKFHLNHSHNIIDRAAHGTMKIELENLQRFSIRFPDLSVQTSIVKRIRTLQISLDQIISISNNKEKCISNLKQSILQKAFTGELSSKTDRKLATCTERSRSEMRV